MNWRTWLPLAHLTATVLLVVWDVVLAGRMAQMRKAPGPFAALTGLAGFLLIPALLVTIAASSAITGRALTSVDWLWPLTAVLFAVQAVYALARGLVYPLLGVPIALYNLVVAAIVVLRYAASHGADLPPLPLFFLAAYSNALTLVAAGAALTSPLFLLPPLISPAFPALRPATAAVRAAVAFSAFLWTILIVISIPPGTVAVRSYAPYASSRIHERKEGDFKIGVKLLPDLARPPAVLALRNDLALADTLEVTAISVTVVPDAVTPLMLDSIARAVEPMRRGDSTLVFVALGYRGKLLPGIRPQRLNERERLRAIDMVVRRLRPDVLMPAEDPYGAGAEALGLLPVETWQRYITDAAALSKRLRPRTRIGIAASSFGRRDSTLYAWAARPGSPVDVVGFSLFPSRLGAQTLDAAMRAADRWMQAERSPKEHWVISTGGFPVAHGEESQGRAIWGVLSWATGHTNIRGVIIHGAGDYGELTGLRAPVGRLRTGALTVARAGRVIRETSITPTDTISVPASRRDPSLPDTTPPNQSPRAPATAGNRTPPR